MNDSTSTQNSANQFCWARYPNSIDDCYKMVTERLNEELRLKKNTLSSQGRMPYK